MEVIQLLPLRPYLVRAFYKWLLDNKLTPYLAVDVTLDGVIVPMKFACNGQIVLNIAPSAVVNLEIGNDKVQFNARFDGVSLQVVAPMTAVLAIYAQENSAGTMFIFESEAYERQVLDVGGGQAEDSKIVMSVIDDARLNNVDKSCSDVEPSTSPQRGQPSLRVIK
ncbi:MAG: ClpXP protease specificity-enhancing factor [Sodalis sp. Ffu]|nr:MAG: ClpXP protease specificity-enhancing factor [Sodalis sp. Ffu]